MHSKKSVSNNQCRRREQCSNWECCAIRNKKQTQLNWNREQQQYEQNRKHNDRRDERSSEFTGSRSKHLIPNLISRPKAFESEFVIETVESSLRIHSIHANTHESSEREREREGLKCERERGNVWEREREEFEYWVLDWRKKRAMGFLFQRVEERVVVGARRRGSASRAVREGSGDLSPTAS